MLSQLHRAQLCNALISVIWPWSAPHFTEEGPTLRTLEASNNRAASSGELLLIDLAIALWQDGSPKCPRVDKLWRTLDRRCWARVVEVLALLDQEPAAIETAILAFAEADGRRV